MSELREKAREIIADMSDYATSYEIADAVLAIAIEECAKVAEAEEELPGDPPPEWYHIVEMVGPEEACRAGVRVTKRNIAKNIRSLHPSRTGERG